jgi:hypothetical protein
MTLYERRTPHSQWAPIILGVVVYPLRHKRAEGGEGWSTGFKNSRSLWQLSLTRRQVIPRDDAPASSCCWH